MPSHGDTRRLDLAVGEVGPLHRLDAVLAEGTLGATFGCTGALGVVLLAELDLARNQHRSALLSRRLSWCGCGSANLGWGNLGCALGRDALCRHTARPRDFRRAVRNA